MINVLVMLSVLSVEAHTSLPAVDDVVAKMTQRDDERRAALEGYTGTRRYVFENVKLHKQAEMAVRLTCARDGSKSFEVLSSSGWSGARKHIFQRLLDAEVEAARPGGSEDSRMSPRNYSFTMLGAEAIDGRLAYALAVEPKMAKKYLVRGTIWVDAEDYAIVRLEGTPAKSPSFWIKGVQIAHKYERHGQFWFAALNRSESDARIFGPTSLRIEYLDYTIQNSRPAVGRVQ